MARWKLSLPLDEARRNDEIISLADSQMLRWIDELNGITDADEKAREIKSEIRRLKKEPNNTATKRAIRKQYADLDKLQFKPDYMCLIIDRDKDYYRACMGFSINGVEYKRLLGTNGGIKNSTIVFVSERLHSELYRRVENGRDPTKELVTAKLEAYKALTCSASIPVSLPNGILVVNDAETEFLSNVVYVSDEKDGEPVMEERENQIISLDASDGYGLMLPCLAERWSRELGLGYTASAMNSRFSFEKGVLVTFDFREFAEKIAGQYMVKDAWGNDVDVRNVEAVFTTSMVKLWDSYESCDDYVSKSLANHYTFGITKTSPEELESERTTNYQFLQSYDLDDEDIRKLIQPTIDEFRDVLSGDWRKSVLFLKGINLTERNIGRLDDDYIKAMMIDHRVARDPYVQNVIYQLIRNRINEAKVGVLKVHGNYSIVTGDPYLLCQSFFGMKPTGLLKAGEIYNQYWADHGAEKLACFRAPMTTHSNIRMVRPVDNEDVRNWYRYIKTTTVFNAWDTATAALNGCDYDGDCVMLTDNEVLVSKLIPMPALMCVQRKADKRISTEMDFIKSNIDSFGNDIGQTTNWITSMFEVRAGFAPESQEYKILTYRIQCGQLYQQNAIDKAKGIVCKPMPKTWHDRHAVNKEIEDPETRELYQRIVADKKPYFMRYIYPDLSKQYNTYIKNTNKNALREFQMTVAEMEAIPDDKLTDRQREFLRYYRLSMPVGLGNCIMNKICVAFEREFDGFVGRASEKSNFDYSVLYGDADYTEKQYNSIKRVYQEYNRQLSNYAIFSDIERVDEDDAFRTFSMINNEFEKACAVICPNEEALCNLLLDLCYSKKSTKRFVWKMCGGTIIRNLLSRHGNTLSFPTLDADGDIVYGGNRFRMETYKVVNDD